MTGTILRLSAAASLLAVLAGCNSSNPSDSLAVNPPAQQVNVAPVVQATCPPITVLDSNAVHQVYAGGAKGDPNKLVYQASISDTTRSCSMNESTLTVNVFAQGRVVPGPLSKPGRVNLPIRVTVKDGDGEIFSQVTSLGVDVPAGDAGTQFIFNNPNVAIPNAPGGASKQTNVFISFDAGGAKAGGKKSGRRG
ncbi:PilZ domain-containing protein [uncultured Agrobacterium sp.]|uniref:PilZ domain-containing protein n=1 Tax=uncultured Agrobacterium sp. TaxID=157277 RepID=UPI0025F0C06F|nr:PilZ domain-containing protein [uncultured Agrobacterium sp.]